jgi:hypothetical protein
MPSSPACITSTPSTCITTIQLWSACSARPLLKLRLPSLQPRAPATPRGKAGRRPPPASSAGGRSSCCWRWWPAGWTPRTWPAWHAAPASCVGMCTGGRATAPPALPLCIIALTLLFYRRGVPRPTERPCPTATVRSGKATQQPDAAGHVRALPGGPASKQPAARVHQRPTSPNRSCRNSNGPPDLFLRALS